MSTSTSSPPARAPWRDAFETELTKSRSQLFSLATIAKQEPSPTTTTTNPSTTKPQFQFQPRVRTCGFRGFFPTPPLREDVQETLRTKYFKHPHALKSPMFGVESDMLTFTTDARMEKVAEMEMEMGGCVEGVFWLAAVGTQLRVRGAARVLGGRFGESGNGEGERERERRGREDVWGFVRDVRDSGDGDDGGGGYLGWDWDRVVMVYFANHSPVLRGSFKAPPPGHPKSEEPPSSLKPGQKISDDELDDPVARSNFRVVAIIPEEVEKLDVSDYEKPVRMRWTFHEDGKGEFGGDERRGRWEGVELWP